MSDPQLGWEGRPEQRHSRPILFCNNSKKNGRRRCPGFRSRLSSVAPVQLFLCQITSIARYFLVPFPHRFHAYSGRGPHKE